MTTPQRRVLLIGDNRSLCSNVRRTLQAHRFAVRLLHTRADSPGVGLPSPPDLLIVDVTESGVAAPDSVRRLKTRAAAPLLALTAGERGAPPGALVAAGADDFLAAPFRDDELLARVDLVLERAGGHAQAPRRAALALGGLCIDLDEQLVTRDGRLVVLSRTDWTLLEVLARNAGRILTPRVLYQQVWDDAVPDDSSLLRTYIGRLRQKLEDDPRRPRFLLTEARLGYRLVAPGEASTPEPMGGAEGASDGQLAEPAGARGWTGKPGAALGGAGGAPGGLEAALAWAAADGVGDELARLAIALTPFWRSQGRQAEARRWLLAALAAGWTTAATRASLQLHLGRLAFDGREFVEAHSRYHESLKLFRALEDTPGVAEALSALGELALAEGHMVLAGSLFEESAKLSGGGALVEVERGA